MDVYEALIGRVSPIDLTEPGPDAETERKIFAAAFRAPDHGRIRPWRFIVVRGQAREKFGDLLAASLKRRDPAASAGTLERERRKAFRAPLIVTVAAKIAQNPKVPAIEQILSAGAAAYGIQIACRAFGFDAVWKTGDAAYDPAVKQALGLDPEDAIVAFLYIGTAKTVPVAPKMPEFADFVRDWCAP
jgi:nitroreductase